MRRVLLASLMVALSLGWMTAPADAAELTWPTTVNEGSPAGNVDYGALCNVGITQSGGGGTPLDAYVQCAYGYGSTPLPTVAGFRIEWFEGSTKIETNLLAGTFTITENSGGRFSAFRTGMGAGTGSALNITSTCNNLTKWDAALGNVARYSLTPTPLTSYRVRYEGCGGTTPTAYPDDWFTGGQAVLPTPSDTPPPCTRVLSQNNGSNIGSFKTNEPVDASVSTAYSWDFGDSSTDATTANPQHIFPALADMPDGGWTTTLTVTRTGDGITTDPGPTVATCSLRVDFLNPTQSVAAGTDQDESDDTDCPTGFGWINPLAILKVLKCLFIPSSESVDSLGDIWGDVTTKAPFSWAYEIVELPAHFFDDMYDSAYEQYNSDGGGPACTNLAPGTAPVGGAEVTNCEIAETIGGSSGWAAVQTVITGLFLIALAMGVYQTVVWTIS